MRSSGVAGSCGRRDSPGLLFLIFPCSSCSSSRPAPGRDCRSVPCKTRIPKTEGQSKTVHHPTTEHPFSGLGRSLLQSMSAMYLVTLGYDLMTASIIMTLMLLACVAGQVMGGHISDRIGRKEFMIFGLAGTIPFFYLFFASTGITAILAILLFGFFLWSTFAVAVAMSHELLPQNIGLASGTMLGLAIGFGGLGVAVNGMIADQYSLAAALGTIPIPIIAAMLLMIILPYPWKSLRAHLAGRISR